MTERHRVGQYGRAGNEARCAARLAWDDPLGALNLDSVRVDPHKLEQTIFVRPASRYCCDRNHNEAAPLRETLLAQPRW